jgi:transporter family protein
MIDIKISWMILGLLSAVFAALVAIFGKIGVSNLDSTLATTVRAVIMALFLIIVSFFMGKLDLIKTIDSKAITFIILAGISGALSWLFYFLALKLGPASGVSALDRLSVVFVLIFSVLFLAEKFTLYKFLGALLITIGAILMIL